MARIHGKRGQVYIDATGGSPSAPNLVADLMTWTLDMATERADVTCFGDTNKQRVSGLPDFSGTLAGAWNSASTPTLFGVVLAGEPVTMKLIPSSAEPTYYFQGLANLDGSINVNVNGAVTIGAKWDAGGNWDMNP